MLQIVRRITYFLICIVLLYWIAIYLRIVDIGLWLFHMSMPVMLAFIFRFIIDPIIFYFHKIPRKVICSVIYTTIIVLFFALLYVVIPAFIEQFVYLYHTYDMTKLTEYMHPFFIPIYDFLVSIEIFDRLLSMLQTALDGVVYWGSNIMIAFGISFYLVFYDVSLCRLLMRSNLPYKEKITVILKEIKQITYRFFKASFLDFLVFFVGSYITFYIIGLDFLLYIAFFLAITNLIPYIGPFIGGIPVIVYGFTIHVSIGYICIFTIFILQFIESNIIQPLLFKKCLSTNPIILIIALSVFGDWFGITGMIVTPLLLGYMSIIKRAIMVENKQ